MSSEAWIHPRIQPLVYTGWLTWLICGINIVLPLWDLAFFRIFGWIGFLIITCSTVLNTVNLYQVPKYAEDMLSFDPCVFKEPWQRALVIGPVFSSWIAWPTALAMAGVCTC